MRRRFGYLHVPKTAGSSVTQALRAAIAAADAAEHVHRWVSPYVMDRTLYGTFDRFDETRRHYMVHTGRPEELAACDVVIGHYSLHSLTRGRSPTDVAIVLREPVARTISHYRYWRSWSEADHASWDPYDASRRAVRLDLADFVDDPAVAPQVDNVVARMLLTPHPLVPIDGFIADDDHEQVTTDALVALRSLGFVDTLERADRCWEALSDWLGAPLAVGRTNVTPTGPGDDAGGTEPAAVDAVRRRTRIDHAVWTAAAAMVSGRAPLGSR